VDYVEATMKKSLGAKTILYPTPVLIVGTYDAQGKANGMAAAWGGICCSRPPCVSVSLRAATYSHGNIVARKAFTVSVPSERYVVEADYFGIVSGRDVDKFAVAELTPVRSELVDAPYVAEFPLVLECKLLHTIEIGLHTEFIGEILDVKADERALDERGRLDIKRVMPVLYAPENRAYFGVGESLGQAFSIGRQIGRQEGLV
jgi:flavin reductase (DIM6/NTAB) family NADH-FMN oxidoreductase RutF